MGKPFWFQKIAKEGLPRGFSTSTRDQTDEARAWFRKRAEKIRNVNVNRIMTDTPSRLFTRGSNDDIGSMLMFFYDAKHKDTLPYWDQFPCAMPMEYYGDSFLSINFHYLPLTLRARLMDALYSIAEREKDKIKRIKLSYDLLAGAKRTSTRYKWFRPCIKKHLFSQVKSRFFLVRPEEWDMCLFLPTARFVGASEAKVFKDSRRKIEEF